MKNRFFLPILGIGLMMAFAISYCSKGSSGYGSNNGNNNGGGGGTTISIANMAYSTTNLSVAAGTKVTWTNNDNVTHTVTADDGSFDSGDITPGYSYSKTFSTKGSYPYHCIYHAAMKATVTVN